MTSFSEKLLRVTLIMAGANSVFPGTNSNTLILDNLRLSARIKANAKLAVQAELQIFGMKTADMNAMTIAWANPPVVLNNLVIIEANNGDGFVQVFKGTIIEAQPNYKDMPNVSFEIQAMTGYYQKIKMADPNSFPAAASIDSVMQNLVNQMNVLDPSGGQTQFHFVNSGVVATLAKGSYYYGTLWDQMAQVCQAVNADFYVQGDEILIVPSGKSRKVKPAIVLRAESGLIGYPSYERSGLVVTALFNPAFACGTPIELVSTVPNATGRWYPYALNHMLDMKVPNGQWHTQMNCLRVLV